MTVIIILIYFLFRKNKELLRIKLEFIFYVDSIGYVVYCCVSGVRKGVWGGGTGHQLSLLPSWLAGSPICHVFSSLKLAQLYFDKTRLLETSLTQADQ